MLCRAVAPDAAAQVASTAFAEVVRRSVTARVVAPRDSTPQTISEATADPLPAMRPANAGDVGRAAPSPANHPGTVEIRPVATASTPISALIQRPMPPKTATSAWFTAANATPASTAVPANDHHAAASY